MSKISKEQITDWTENPVTLAIIELCEKELDDIKDTPMTECFVPGDPTRTQENLIELEARERVWGQWVAFLQGDWSYFEEDEEVQHERNNTTGY